jgi:hypothetical protein
MKDYIDAFVMLLVIGAVFIAAALFFDVFWE